MIRMSDQTYLSNFSGDKKVWPVYIILGNLPSSRRNSPGSMAVFLLALLPVSLKLSKSTSADKHQRLINAETLQLVFQLLFEPLQAMARKGVNIDCADGMVRRCFPVLSVWIADHMENVALHGVKSNFCLKCKVLLWELGKDTKYSARDYTEYEYCERENWLQSPGSDSDDTDDAADQNRLARVNWRADLIQRETHFNFIKMHYLSHFASHVRRFGSMFMYSTEMGELAYKEQIKEGYSRSNKNNAT